MKSNQNNAATSGGRRTALVTMAAAGLLAVSPFASAQDTWKPSGPVKMIVPWSPGGTVDVLIRIAAPLLSERLGQPVIVENRVGASGSIATAHVYSAQPDGLTLLVAVSDPYPHLAKVSFDPTKFVPVASIGSGPMILIARPGIAANNANEFITLAKGTTLNAANVGTGGSVHMAWIAFARAAGIGKLVQVPYPGMAPAIQAVMADQVDAVFPVAGGTSQYKGRVKYLGIASTARVPALADVPTFVEQGVDFKMELLFGLLAPPGTPANISATLAKHVGEVVSSQAYRTRTTEMGVLTQPLTQQEYAKLYQDDYLRWGELIRSANVKLE
jgi:tripartite-type tricarboxylate transporter receptor subunit TctC